MSLDFHTRNVKDKEACWVKKGGETKATPELEVMVWTSLQIGLGDITEKNLPEWKFRIAVMHQIGMGIAMHPDGPDAAFEATLGHLRTFMGLHTNVSDETRAWFYRKVKTLLADRADGLIRAHEQKKAGTPVKTA